MDVLGVKLPAQQLVGIAPQTPSPNPDCNSLGNMLVGEAAITGAVPFIVAPLLQGHQATSATKQPSFSNDILECIIVINARKYLSIFTISSSAGLK